MTTATEAKTTTSAGKTRHSISVYGETGWLEVCRVSESAVRVTPEHAETTTSTAAAVFGRRMSRALGRGVYCCGLRHDHSEMRRDGTAEARVYELTFGYSCRSGGTVTVGRCWVKVYC